MILAFLQNQWVHNPERTAKTMKYVEEKHGLIGRARSTHYMLFAGCKTGRVLKKSFGEDLCSEIIWDNASPELGGESSALFPADLDHMRRLIDHWKPNLIVCFGGIAITGMNQIEFSGARIDCPHPASRGADVMTILIRKAEECRKYV